MISVKHKEENITILDDKSAIVMSNVGMFYKLKKVRKKDWEIEFEFSEISTLISTLKFYKVKVDSLSIDFKNEVLRDIIEAQ